MGLFSKLFGSHNDNELKKIYPIVDKIEALEPDMQKLSDEELKAKTDEFKARFNDGEDLDSLLPEAFAAVREAAWRVLGMKPYRVQLIGGVVLHQGRIAEMKTGEGKTLVAVMPAYLNAIAGEGVHIVTVNDYLARRDSEWMGKVHRFMGLTVGLVVPGNNHEERKAAYQADITYCTNNELGFDYLRDNIAVYKEQLAQRGHSFAIVDEVDSILIDEARTPLIISGQASDSSEMYKRADDFVRSLKKLVVESVDSKEEENSDIDADYVVDEKAKKATLTARGIAKAERTFNLENYADPENSTVNHHINKALHAHGVMKNDVDYIVRNNQILIVDEFTGRIMHGRRYSDGLHQAIEAKENVDVKAENKTVASITFQNFFRMYDKLSGMTGTAKTEEEEFGTIYKLDIVEIPPNKPVQRIDNNDVIYKDESTKFAAIVNQIIQCHEKGQPVLVGTASVEKSEALSRVLKTKKIEHNVLNAKNHDKEAQIIAQAGRLGAVTIATNMAGRGTDIMLGGNPEYLARVELRRKYDFTNDVIAEAMSNSEKTYNKFLDPNEIARARTLYLDLLNHKYKSACAEEAEKVREAGGLFVIGTERHESRRIDNPLRGRSGRQGDPGESRFYIAMTDDIIRLFGGERVQNIMETLGQKALDNDALDSKLLGDTVERAQKNVESRNFQTRKHVLEYDDVVNQQRNIIYEERRKVLDGEDISEHIDGMIRDFVSSEVNNKLQGCNVENQEMLDDVMDAFSGILPADFKPTMDDFTGRITSDKMTDFVYECCKTAYERKQEGVGEMTMRNIERNVLLRTVDEYWSDHIDAMDELKHGIELRGYGNTKPIDAYKQEGFEMFEAMTAGIREDTVRGVLTFNTSAIEERRRAIVRNVQESRGGGEKKKQPVKKAPKISPNAPCPCGKWKDDGSRPLKYKECCGKL